MNTADDNDVWGSEEEMRKYELEDDTCSKGICPRCKGKVILLLTLANDGCFSEHFSCTKCDFKLPHGAMTKLQGQCVHFDEVGNEGHILTGIREITNTAHMEFKVYADGKEVK